MNAQVLRTRRLAETLAHQERCQKGIAKEAINKVRRERPEVSGRQWVRQRKALRRAAKESKL